MVADLFWSMSAIFGFVGLLYVILLAGIGAWWWKDITIGMHHRAYIYRISNSLFVLLYAHENSSAVYSSGIYSVMGITGVWTGLGVIMIVAGALIAVANE
jgi:hypothetical protein